MHKVNKRLLMILLSLCFASLVAGVSLIYSENRAQLRPTGEAQMPIFLAHLGSSPTLERPPVGFDHDLHTAALKQSKIEDCAVCHVLKETDKRLINPEVKIFGFPKDLTGRTDKTAIMYSYHNQCVACHQKTGSEGKKSGPDIGLCGKCHVRRADVTKTAWTWSPLFNYARHAKHAEAAKQFDASEGLNVVDKIQVIGEIPDSKKGCLVCHHIYDEGLKKLVYKNDTENSCRACHKAEDIQNARSMKKVAHAACVGCHMKLAERAKQEALRQGRAELTEQERKRFGPFVCKGCHGEHKELTPDQIVKTPRLDRGQKDMIDVALGAVESSTVQKIQQPLPVSALPVRMKAVPFNHKSHETRTQFCNTCHHHSLEKCDKCHTPAGDSKKGGGITYERAFHKPDAQQSCVGCHSAAKEDKKCAGCHQWMKTGLPQSSCQVCHRGPSEGKIV
ncbi:MAG: cytochrome c3 family protein, partial [Thermodesulfobacteriota bacterium]